MAIACLVSGVLTLRGMRLLRSDGFFDSWVQPTMLAVFSALGCFIFWQIIIRFYPRSTAGGKRQLLVVSLLLVAFALTTSTFFSAFGMSADKAVMRHITMVTDEARSTLILLHQRRKQEANFANHLGGMGDVNASMVQREIDGGPLSGRKGSGKVASNVSGLGDGYRNAADRLIKQGKDADRLYSRGDRLLSEINKIISNDKISIREKSRAVEVKLAAVNIVLTKLQDSTLPWIQDLVERMDTLYLAKGDAAMQKAVSRLSVSITEGKDVLQERLADLEQESDVPVVSYRIPDQFEAIMLHWEYVVPSFMYSLATDLFAPALSLFFLSFISSFFRPKQSSRINQEEEVQDETSEPEYRKPTDIEVAARLRRIHRRTQDDRNGQSRRDDGNGRRPPSSY